MWLNDPVKDTHFNFIGNFVDLAIETGTQQYVREEKKLWKLVSKLRRPLDKFIIKNTTMVTHLLALVPFFCLLASETSKICQWVKIVKSKINQSKRNVINLMASILDENLCINNQILFFFAIFSARQNVNQIQQFKAVKTFKRFPSNTLGYLYMFVFLSESFQCSDECSHLLHFLCR